MDKYKLMDLIYDKLADNDEQEQFEPSMTEAIAWSMTGKMVVSRR